MFLIITLLLVFLDTSRVYAKTETYSCGSTGLLSVTSNPTSEGKTQILASLTGLPAYSAASYKLIIQENTASGWQIINDSDTDIGKSGNGTKSATFSTDFITSGSLRVIVEHVNTVGIKGNDCIQAQTFNATSAGGGGGGSAGGSSSPAPISSSGAITKVQKSVKWAYLIAFPIAIIIGVIKILINLIKLATSQGDPGKLQEVKEELYAVLMGLLLIGGAATLINILGNAFGI